MKQALPSIRETAFDCPHCRAFAQQSWSSLGANTFYINRRIPVDPDKYTLENAESNPLVSSNILSGYPTLNPTNYHLESLILYNTFISSCFNCKKVSIWLCDNLIYPQSNDAPPANTDLPDDIREDYDEASNILNLSPRGAAALLRLVIQKLCKELGQKGENINDDIAALVSEGLNQHIQRALDTVRVIGNNAVHPGQIDLRDDREIALSLFAFVNLIVDKMISEPKRIEEAYKGLPERAREAIEKRDA